MWLIWSNFICVLFSDSGCLNCDLNDLIIGYDCFYLINFLFFHLVSVIVEPGLRELTHYPDYFSEIMDIL